MMEKKVMEREERIARILIRISNWWERQKSRISNYIFIKSLRFENPKIIVQRIEEKVQSWNSKYANHCEMCHHPELRTLYWLNDPDQGFKYFECTRCHHKQSTDLAKSAWNELSKTRIVVMKKGAPPRYMILTPKEQIWLCFVIIIALLVLDFFFIKGFTRIQ